MRRLFAAIKIYPNEKLNFVIDDFRKELSSENIKWVNPKNIHITLKFFGDTHEKDLDPIIRSLSYAAQKSIPFSIKIKGCGSFGSPRFPRVLWLGMEKIHGIKELYENINIELKKIGYQPDKRGFSPHLTLGRVKHIKNLYTLDAILSKYADEDFLTQKITKIHLFESILQKEGPQYNILKTFDL